MPDQTLEDKKLYSLQKHKVKLGLIFGRDRLIFPARIDYFHPARIVQRWGTIRAILFQRFNQAINHTAKLKTAKFHLCHMLMSKVREV
mgnify:FL=1